MSSYPTASMDDREQAVQDTMHVEACWTALSNHATPFSGQRRSLSGWNENRLHGPPETRR